MRMQFRQQKHFHEFRVTAMDFIMQLEYSEFALQIFMFIFHKNWIEMYT